MVPIDVACQQGVSRVNDIGRQKPKALSFGHSRVYAVKHFCAVLFILGMRPDVQDPTPAQQRPAACTQENEAMLNLTKVYE